MKLYQLVFKDILRRKKRVLYATLGVVIATMTVVGILTIAQTGQAKIYAQLEKYGANLSVVPAARNLTTSLGDLNVGTVTLGETYIQEDQLPQIRQITDSLIREKLNITRPGNVATLAPQLLVQADVQGSPVIAAGIDPSEEMNIKTWWKITRGKYFDGDNQAVVGSQAAQVLKLNPGDAFQLKDQQLTVAGVLDETGSGDDYQIFVPLPLLQKAFDKQGLISTLDVRALCNGCPVETIATEINNNVSGVRAVAVKQIAASEMGMLEKVQKLMLALAGVTLVVGIFGVINTLMTSINQRIKDIGIMRAVGASRNQIIKAFIYEAIVIGVGGGVIGYLAGTALAFVIGPLIFEGTAIKFIPVFLPISMALAILIAIVSTLYPAYHASKIKVADSFRSI